MTAKDERWRRARMGLKKVFELQQKDKLGQNSLEGLRSSDKKAEHLV